MYSFGYIKKVLIFALYLLKQYLKIIKIQLS